MSVERHAGKLEIVCDECGTSSGTYESDEFDVMTSDFKDKGGRIIKDNEEWTHICGPCREKNRQRR